MGKTAFALNIALFAAMEAQTPAAIFSLEMSKEHLLFDYCRPKARLIRSG